MNRIAANLRVIQNLSLSVVFFLGYLSIKKIERNCLEKLSQMRESIMIVYAAFIAVSTVLSSATVAESFIGVSR